VTGKFKPSRSDCARLRRRMRLAETRAVRIRKRLNQVQPSLRRRGTRGSMSDAVRLCGTVERLARYAVSCSAEEAVEIEMQIDTLVSLLQIEIDNFLTF
jgi:hypothetical protein